ncbi:chemotaxis response regulator protein-glutamate methylesterase [Asticcacaulis sp. AC402]|uniref:protein-glutamate methylesterase/protein-glutamine glutaminase n=1 Tax=Asticcacaulis sp. AC402 TaxID=1282361 RepID=UPI0003C3EB2E|nr:chemotaxis response regulator protein-glutamate methylesterase [Asticcacaulis sp. AC402]ESQ77648.1 chemotaxis protein [Asticcacaulis sp. AC402]
MKPPIRVLIIDDSALMRQMLTAVLSQDPDIHVVDTAADPLIAREKIKKHNPDVITLDVEMPRMNGLEFLSRLMALRPMPVVMISSLTASGADAALRALDLGAFDVVGKPSGFMSDGMMALGDEIRAKVRMAAASRIEVPPAATPVRRPATKPGTNLVADRIIAIGASTGGVPALTAVLSALPVDMPPIVIVQHMPASFTARFAARLNELCAVKIYEGQDGQTLRPGEVYVAPGGRMMRVRPAPGNFRLAVSDETAVGGFCPSVDVLFQSVADTCGKRAVGVILTGMGRDGAEGLLQLRRCGAATLGQDEASCVVYGMPRVAAELGAVERQLPPARMAQALIDLCTHPLVRTG